MEKAIQGGRCPFAPKEVKGVILSTAHRTAVSAAVGVHQQMCLPIFEVHIRHRFQYCALCSTRHRIEYNKVQVNPGPAKLRSLLHQHQQLSST